MNKKPSKGEYLETLLRSQQTIFSAKDISLLWKEGDSKIITNRLKKYIKAGKLVRVYRGLYAKDKNYNKHILDGLGELLEESQKDSVRTKLRNDAIFSLKLMLNNLKS